MAITAAVLLLAGCTTTSPPIDLGFRRPPPRTAVASAAPAIPVVTASTLRNTIRRPAYDRLGGGLLLPVVPERAEMASRVLRLDLATGSLAPLPDMPCGLPAGTIATLGDGRLLAVGHFSSNSDAWSQPTDASKRRYDVSVLQLPSGKPLWRRAARRFERVEDMAAPDPAGDPIYLAVRNGAYPSPLEMNLLRRYEARTGVESEAPAWPGSADVDRPGYENAFAAMGAPHWVEPDGSGRLALVGFPLSVNPRFSTKFLGRRHHFLFDPRTGGLAWHPRTETLRDGWSTQRLGTDVLFDAGVGQGPQGQFLYGLRRMTPSGDEAMLELGPAFPWFFAFEHGGQRLVAVLGANGLIRIRALADGRDVLPPLRASELLTAARAAPCAGAWPDRDVP